MLETAQIGAAGKIGMSSLGSGKNPVPAFIGLGRVAPAESIMAVALDGAPANLEFPDEKLKRPLGRNAVCIPATTHLAHRFTAGPRKVR